MQGPPCCCGKITRFRLAVADALIAAATGDSCYFLHRGVGISVRTSQLAFYLAFKEICRNRGRFFLVSLVIALITLLVLFIAALGEGLANGNRQYVAGLDAQLVIFL